MSGLDVANRTCNPLPLTAVIGSVMTTQNAIIRQANVGDLALPAELVDAARDYARASHAKRTREAYARAWQSFAAWCAERQLEALPAAQETSRSG
jgi:hypothetical protein